MVSRQVVAVVGASLVATALAAQVLQPQPVGARGFDLDAQIPPAFGEWRVDPSIQPIAPSPDVQANLDKIYEQIVTRTYVNQAGERIMLVVAYGGEQSDSLKAHRQEVCYAAQGFAIRSVRSDSTRFGSTEVPIVRVHAVKGRRSEPVSYWFTMGDRVLMGRGERLLAQIGHGLRGEIPDGMLVRVSSLSSDTAASYRAHDQFLATLVTHLSPDARTRLAGLPRPAS
jgi:EpsI family protein